MMPEMDGFQFRGEQLKNPSLSGVPVALMSARTNLQQHADQLGAVGYLDKPIDVERLLALLRQHCG
jgi:CheY-like chemotaxis protein